MSTTLSIRLPLETKKRLETLARRSRRSKSHLAVEAISAYVDGETWQLEEIEAAIDELEAGRSIDHAEVTRWLQSWGKARERKPPRR